MDDDHGSLSDPLEIAWLPTSAEGGSLWPVDAEVDEPAFARDGLDPPGRVLAGRWIRAEEQINAFAGQILQLEQGAQSGLALIGVDLAASFCVVDRHRPEQARRYGQRNA